MVLAGIWPRSLVAKSVRILRINNPADIDDPEYRGVEIPSANGIGQAQAVATSVRRSFSGVERNLGSRRSTWREMVAPAISPQLGTQDAIFKIDTRVPLWIFAPQRRIPIRGGRERIWLSRRRRFVRNGRSHRAIGICLPDEQDGFSAL